MYFVVCINYSSYFNDFFLPKSFFLRQGGYVFAVVCLSVCLSVSNFAQKVGTDLREIFREGWQWANEQMIKF